MSLRHRSGFVRVRCAEEEEDEKPDRSLKLRLFRVDSLRQRLVQVAMLSRFVVVVVQLLICIFRVCHAAVTPIDNGVEGQPEIVCRADSIEVRFRTRNTFGGRLYIKGHYADTECKVAQGQLVAPNTPIITVPFSKCGVQRIRSLNPSGVSVRTTVVIAFHEKVLTQVDSAYAVQCFYMEAEKTVGQNLDVSDFTTSAEFLITQQAAMPVCRYEVLENGPDDRPVHFAIIGQQVYHKWTCESELQNVFCIVVHNCVAQNGFGDEAQLLDNEGCAVDRYLLQNLEYINDMVAGQEAHVFKFADQPALYFQCQITISVKEPGSACPRPQCQSNGNNGPLTPAPEAFNDQPSQIGPIPSSIAISPPSAAPPNFTAQPVSRRNPSTNKTDDSVQPIRPRFLPTAKTFLLRHSRQLRNRNINSDTYPLGVWDVQAEPITTLEIDENGSLWRSRLEQLSNVQRRSGDGVRNQICLHTITFGFMFSLAIAAALAAGTSVIVFCRKKSSYY